MVDLDSLIGHSEKQYGTISEPLSRILQEIKIKGAIVIEACLEAEKILKGKSEQYIIGFVDGAKWRIKLFQELEQPNHDHSR